MKIERIKLSELSPLSKNVRKHNEVQLKEFVRSLNQFGQTRAIVIDEDNNILVGNGLYMAMTMRGDVEADCTRVLGLSEKEKKKLVLTDNKIYSLGVDDYENMQDFITEITADGDFDIAGFGEDILQAMSRDIDDVTKDIMDYGKTPDDLPTPEVMPSKGVETPSGEFAKNESTFIPDEIKAPEEPVKENKSVICPSCGEVIYLD